MPRFNQVANDREGKCGDCGTKFGFDDDRFFDRQTKRPVCGDCVDYDDVRFSKDKNEKKGEQPTKAKQTPPVTVEQPVVNLNPVVKELAEIHQELKTQQATLTTLVAHCTGVGQILRELHTEIAALKVVVQLQKPRQSKNGQKPQESILDEIFSLD
jgi:hypothetical protein